MLIFETHAHYDDEKFDPWDGEGKGHQHETAVPVEQNDKKDHEEEPDRHSLLSSMPQQGIGPLINVGSTMDASKASLSLAEEYPFVYAAIGVHPSDLDTLDEEGMQWLKEHAKDPKVAAIGEIGLDYYWEKDPDARANQKTWFKRQTQLAREEDLPVIIHSRDACEDTLAILKEEIDKGTRGVMHCFSYSPEVAMEYVKMGFYVGIGGVVTFKNGKKMKETVQRVPLSRILVETDAPYLAPEPFRGKRNDSTYLPYIVRAIAKLREITEDEVIEATAENARRLFSKATYRG